MKFFNNIINYLKEIFYGFRMRKRDVVAPNKGEHKEGTKRRLKAINQKIADIIEKGESYSGQVKEILGYKTGLELENLSVKDRSIPVEIRSIRKEVDILNKRIYEIDSKKHQLQQVLTTETPQIDKDIAELERILQGHSIIPPSVGILKEIEKRNTSFDSTFNNKRILKTYNNREEIRQRKEQNKRVDIQNRFSSLQESINSDELLNVGRQTRILNTFILGVSDLAERERFLNRLATFKHRLLSKEVKRQAAVLEKQRQVAEVRRKKEKEKRRKEEAKKQREKAVQEAERLTKQREKEEKKQKIESLLVKKSNWTEYEKILKENNITTFYHFTDRVNLESIKMNKGLFSWNHLDKKNINVVSPGSGVEARWEAKSFGLSDYISLSFVKDHPMKYVARKEGRISNPIILEISIEACFWKETQFSTMNAADNRSIKGKNLEVLKKCKFSIFNQNYFNLEGLDKKYYQAEILIKTRIPIKYITNINQF